VLMRCFVSSVIVLLFETRVEHLSDACRRATECVIFNMVGIAKMISWQAGLSLAMPTKHL